MRPPTRGPVGPAWRGALVGAAILVGAAVPVSARSTPRAVGPPVAARVVHVVDGDTITVRIGEVKERVRLLGIDAPELHDTRAPWREAGERAKDYAMERLKGRTVTLEGDPVDRDRDDYGRLLRYVTLGDGTNFNEEMVERGMARAYTRFPFSLAARFRAAEGRARASKLGIWTLPPGPPRIVEPDERRRRPR